jgi:hypothetical protein
MAAATSSNCVHQDEHCHLVDNTDHQPQDLTLPVKFDPDKDTDSQCMGILMFNLYSLKYQPEFSSTTDFYNQYRNLVIASLKKKGDIVGGENNLMLEEDEELSPTFEELILANVLGLIDSRLPGYLRDHWYTLMRVKSKNLMDYKTDILTQVVPTFLAEMESRGDLALPKSEVDSPPRY